MSQEDVSYDATDPSSCIPIEQFLDCEKEFWKMMSSLVKRLPKKASVSPTTEHALPMKIEMDTTGFVAFRGMFDRMQ